VKTGVTVICCAGNSSSVLTAAGDIWPQTISTTTCVGATDKDDMVAVFDTRRNGTVTFDRIFDKIASQFDVYGGTLS
jgi:hypothetical protein